jgi:hypothetical protein
VLSENEEDYRKYIAAYDRHRAGEATKEDEETIKILKGKLAEHALYFDNQERID